MSDRQWRRRAAAAVGVLMLTAGVAGCDASAGQPPGGVVHFSSPPAPPNAHTVRVGLIEWSITTSRPEVSPGRVLMLVTNAGGTVHDLAVRGDLGQWQTEDLHPGQHARLVVHARPGETLSLWCTEPGHAAQGMRTTLSVG